MNYSLRLTLCLLLLVFGGLLMAQTPSPSPKAVPAVTPVPVAGSPLVGTWQVDRAIFELFGNLKDVTSQDERFYSLVKLENNGKGSLLYSTKASEVPIEYDSKNGQSLTLAYGSRLKPQVDLFNMIILSDGNLFLRSSRLAQVNGTIIYLCHKLENSTQK